MYVTENHFAIRKSNTGHCGVFFARWNSVCLEIRNSVRALYCSSLLPSYDILDLFFQNMFYRVLMQQFINEEVSWQRIWWH